LSVDPEEKELNFEHLDKLKSAKQLFQEREKRITDAIQLKVPDRIPVQLFAGYFPAKYTGITCEAVYYDAEKWRLANRKTILDFAPDTYWVQGATVSGISLDILGARQIRWPGHGASPDHSHQMVELEPMKEDEYDAFLSDPSDYIIRTYLPRIWDAASPFGKFPPFQTLIGPTSLAMFAGQLARPDFTQALDSIRKAGEAQLKWQSEAGSFTGEMAELGFPDYTNPRMIGLAPFDIISDNLRGMRGAMLDMYKHPDELLQACDMLAADRIRKIKRPDEIGDGEMNKRVFIPLHRGSDGFMSVKQFERFYWPTLKQVMVALIDKGWIPCPFCEGTWDTRLEYLSELPKGKALCHFAQTDVMKAKEVLGGHLCIMKDVPASLLQAGTVREVEDYCQRLIDTFAENGGFIVTATCIDEANPANIKAMIEFVKKHGKH
jgi:hypothetical protein